MTSATIHDFPGKQVSLEYSSPEEWSDESIKTFVLDSVFLFANEMTEFIAADLWVGYYDTTTRLPENDIYSPQPFWMLKEKDLPAEINITPAWENEKIVQTDKITPDSINDWIKKAVAANKPGEQDRGVCWRQIIFSVTRACSFLQADHFTENEITVKDEARVYTYPIERKENMIWITGPLQWKSLYAPIRIVADNYSGFINLRISFYWSLWTDTDMPGTMKANELIEKLLQNGWSYSS